MPVQYKWPKHIRFCGYNSDKVTMFKSKNRKLDLFDNFILPNLFSLLDYPYYLAVTIDDPKWEILSDSGDGVWDEETLEWFEMMIEDDFEYDGVAVHLTRMFDEGWPRSTSAIWKIEKKNAPNQ